MSPEEREVLVKIYGESEVAGAEQDSMFFQFENSLQAALDMRRRDHDNGLRWREQQRRSKHS